jgi:GNAT superfamily N-acetyltransferase
VVDQAYLDSLKIQDRVKSWKKIMQEKDHRIFLSKDKEGNGCGFVSFGKLRTPLPGMSPIRPLYSGEVYAIYTLPESWGTGLGQLLMKKAAEELAEMKHKSLCLWVLEKNKRAVSFYKKMGGQRCGKQNIEIGPTTAKEIAFGWRDSNVLLTN